jgi:tripartite-type tricarboxylate transporter receptor subunit TctC
MRRRALLATTLLATPALAWPDRPLRLLVGYPPGGGTDIMARAVAARLGRELGQSVVVENRTGASGTIAAAELARATPDGHVLLFVTGSEMALRPLLDRQLPYDAERDFQPIALLGRTPVALAVHGALPVANVPALVALAKARPGELGYASTGIAGLMHMAGELFLRRAGVELLHVPYRGAAPAVNDTAAGQVAMTFSGLPPVLPLAASGRLRILAVCTPRRFPAIPEVPTLAEAGLEGFDMANSVGLVGLRGLPAAVLERLASAANASLADPALGALFRRNGAEPLGSSPSGYAEAMAQERAYFAAVIRETGIRLE